jgi:hypothetical protein
MDTETAIAFLALCLSPITPIITGYFAVKINKENQKAKRLDMAYDKQMEAFRRIIELVGKIRYYCAKKDISKSFFDELKKLHKELFDYHQQQRAFLPDSYDSLLLECSSLIFQYAYKEPDGLLSRIATRRTEADSKNMEDFERFYGNLKELQKKLVDEAHQYMELNKPATKRIALLNLLKKVFYNE